MIKQIRRGVFETNSSSSHSISVSSSKCKYDLHVENGQVIVFCGEFGWEEKSYTDSKTKLSYLVTALASTVENYDNNLKKKNTPFEECIKNSSHYNEYLQLCEVIKECCNADLVVLPEATGYHPFGYIDHASSDIPFEVLSKGPLIIRQFLFSDKSILQIDNDNH